MTPATVRLKGTIQRAWLHRRFLARVLWPLSQVYRFLAFLHRSLYLGGFLQAEQVRVPVVVVGNLVAGGAGKTPLVLALVRHLQSQGLQAGIVSRGYGRQGRDCREVTSTMSADECGDEPLFLKRQTDAPVFVAPTRASAAKALLEAHPDVALLIADDGLQHYALARDINIAVFDDRGVGNGWLLPAGPLREPWPMPANKRRGLRQNPLQKPQPSGVHGIDLVLHSGQVPAFSGFTSTRRLKDTANAADGAEVHLSELKSQRLVALAGIANPQAFFTMLRQRGLDLESTQAFPDHHDFASSTLVFDEDTTILCTEKDAVKLFALYPNKGRKLLAVPLEFSPEPAFFAAFDQLMATLVTPHSLFPPLTSPYGHKTS